MRKIIFTILIILSLTSISYADNIKELCDKNVCLVAFDFGFGFGFGGGQSGPADDGFLLESSGFLQLEDGGYLLLE